MHATPPEYARFLARLKTYERIEPFPKSRGAEKLAGVRHLAAALGHPERAFQVVHVAGTNGKGLTSAMVAALLLQAGEATGLYTSPHVMDIRERIAIGGAPVDESAFAAAGHAVLDVADAERDRVHFSYFDLLTMIAFVAFRSAGVRWAVLETGLGGLSDATNITDKALCVITRIGRDHLHVLGDTLEAIATQKLGICRSGVPTVVGVQPPELQPWLAEQLAARKSPAVWAEGFRLAVETQPVGVTAQWPDGGVARCPLPPDAPLPAAPHLACAANALAAAEALVGPAEGGARAERLGAVLAVRLPGRLELRRAQPLPGGTVLPVAVLDGGHNAEAMAALVAQLEAWDVRDYTLLLSLQSDKLVAPLREPLGRLLRGAAGLLLLLPQTARAPSMDALQAYLADVAGGADALPPTTLCADPAEALRTAATTPQRPLVVTGSFWMLGDVMRLMAEASEGRYGA